MIALVSLFVALAACAAEKPDMKLYDGAKYRYTISYPAGWHVYDRNDGTVVFKDNSKKSAYPSSVNIQTIYTKKANGTYKDVKELMDDFSEQAKHAATDVKFLERKPITLIEKNGVKISGEETMMSFRDHGKTLKQWQVMVVTNDGKLFQAWAYRASEQNFDKYLGVAKKMLDSWNIK